MPAAPRPDPENAQTFARQVVEFANGAALMLIIEPGTRDETLYAAATIVDERGGVVGYDWQPSDTDAAGAFNAAWEVVYPDGRRLIFDDPNPPTVEIVGDLDIDNENS